MTNQTEAYRKPELELVGFDGDVILTSGPLPTCTTEFIACPNEYICPDEEQCFEDCSAQTPELCLNEFGG